MLDHTRCDHFTGRIDHAANRTLGPDGAPLAAAPVDAFGMRAFEAATGTDLFIGRNTFGILAAMNLEQITVDYIVVDTVRVPRDTFAAIIGAWRDGYAEPIGELTPITRQAAIAYFDQMIANIRNPHGYAVWMVPVIGARVS